MTLFVIGNVTEDIVFGLPRLPSDGETLIAVSRIVDIGGKGLNQALIAARSGMKVRLVTAIGHDDAGRRARDLIAAEPFDAVLIEKDTATDQSIIAVAQSGENHIISSAFSASALSATEVIAAIDDAVSGDQLLMQGNLSHATTLDVLQWARSRGLRTTVNPSPIRWDYDRIWPLVDRVILNRTELHALTGCTEVDDGIAALAVRGLSEIIVTLGADGAVLVAGDGRTVVTAAIAKVVDTAGAGDTFCGVFIAAEYLLQDSTAAMQLAARAAAITIGRSGTWSAFPSTGEITAIFGLTTKGINRGNR